jgi:hypothetical protein
MALLLFAASGHTAKSARGVKPAHGGRGFTLGHGMTAGMIFAYVIQTA